MCSNGKKDVCATVCVGCVGALCWLCCFLCFCWTESAFGSDPHGKERNNQRLPPVQRGSRTRGERRTANTLTGLSPHQTGGSKGTKAGGSVEGAEVNYRRTSGVSLTRGLKRFDFKLSGERSECSCLHPLIINFIYKATFKINITK